jgi:hypothetical protein
VIFTLALRSLLARPIRSAVLAGGFGLGVAVMAALLGIGGVILEQARTPALVGGGDVMIASATGRIGSARFVMSNVLGGGSLGDRAKVLSPSVKASLYLIDDRGATAIVARGGIPSRERSLGDPETSGVGSWVDTAADRGWLSPTHEDILRTMDRFHEIPDVPARASSWSEWLYFNGQAGSTRFYLTFLAGPRLTSGKRTLGTRLQLDRGGKMTSYSHASDVTDDELASAPDISAGANSVRLVGSEYRIRIDLPAESGGPRVSGEIIVRAVPGQSMPPFTMRGAGGWMSGYVVPVMAGELAGTIAIGRDTIDLTGGAGYHDHNWGFWEGVRWQWGQVKGVGLSFVYGRVFPPADAADSARLPGFLVALGPEGPIGYATDVSIDERDAGSSAEPRRIVVTGRSDSLALTLDIAIDHVTTTRMGAGAFGDGMNFLQMRGEYRVTGSVGERAIGFTAPGSAETFRGR